MSKTEKILQDFNDELFRQDLIKWFRQEQRDLPWRKTKDPYHIWISEIMLQQTRVDTVIPYFNIFTNLFPTPSHLATAEEEKVLKAWEGLGYYSRARNLHQAVKEVHEKYGGKVPNDPLLFGDLKGVGPYTKGAVMSIAYNHPEPAVDGNVMRVMSRILTIWDDIAKPSTRKTFEEVIRKIISKDSPSDFNQGLMELGAMVCTPTNPACLICPVQEHCRAFEQGVQKELPVKAKKKQTRVLQMAAGVFMDSQGRICMNQRPSEGLLANMWEFPNLEVSNRNVEEEELIQYCKEEMGITVKISGRLQSVKHIFSHLTWEIHVFIGEIKEVNQLRNNVKIGKKEQIEQLPISVSHQKIFENI